MPARPANRFRGITIALMWCCAVFGVLLLCVAAGLAYQAINLADQLRPVVGTVVELREHRRGHATIVTAGHGAGTVEVDLEGLERYQRIEVGTVLTVFCGTDDSGARCLASPSVAWIGPVSAALAGLLHLALGTFFIVSLRRPVP